MTEFAYQPRGLYFEDFEIGQIMQTAARTITETDVVNFAGLSGDFNRIHTDAVYAAQDTFGQRVAHGLLVQGAQGAAARAGLSRGDVVLAINGQPVDSVETLQRVLAAHPKRVALLVWRAGEQLFVPVAPV